MEINKHQGLSEILSPLSSEDRTELNPLEEIFGVRSNSRRVLSEPKDLKLDKERDSKDLSNESNHCKAKRQRSMEYRVMMEKKRRQLIRDKVDILQEMTPNCSKSDIATKLENIVDYIKSLKHQTEMMSMAYREPTGYMSPFYGAQAPCMFPYTTPWGYYAPLMPHPFIPQFHQVHDTARTDQTQP